MSFGKQAVTLVIGLGEVGRPLFSILQKTDPDVIGIDIEPKSVDQPVGVLHVCFPFEDPARFHSAVLSYALKYTPEVIVVNSTVVPGTTRSIEESSNISCVYSPIRGKHTKMVEDMYKYVKFVAGIDTAATKRVKEHFLAAGLQSESVAAPETLELAKLLETTYFGLLIAWAQEMNRFAGAIGGDYLEIGKFFREIGYLPPVLFQPGVIGGHCVMPNIALLQHRFQSSFLDAIQSSNVERKAELAAQEQELKERLQPLALK